MKKLFLIIVLLIFVLSASNAQFTKVGGGLALTSGFPFHQLTADANRSGIFGLSFKGIYEINVPLHISPSFSIFYPHITKTTQFNEDITTTISSMMFDVNGHYVFNSLDKFEFYGLAGIDILLTGKKDIYRVTGTTSTVSKIKESDNTLGLNLGIGTYMKLTEQFDLSAEAKYIFSKYDQFMLNVGILVNLDWLKKNENPGL
jgi:opacity protein-like surface antigen